MVHLVLGHLQHLFFEAYGVTAGALLGAAVLALKNTRAAAHGAADMRRIRPLQRNLLGDGRCPVKSWRAEIARAEIWRVCVGDVLGEQTLALLVPLHLRAEH